MIDEDDTLARLLAVAEGKPPFENLSWRLLRLLIRGTTVRRRELEAGETLTLGDDVAMVYVERGGLTSAKVPPAGAAEEARKSTAAHKTARLPPGKPITQTARAGRGKDLEEETGQAQRVLSYAQTYLVSRSSSSDWIKAQCRSAAAKEHDAKRFLIEAGTYQATTGSVIRQFFKGPASKRGKMRGSRDARAASGGGATCGWERLLDHSLVARRALLGAAPPAGHPCGEVVLLKSRDLVEYLPALTELLAQKMACDLVGEQPAIGVILVRFDPGVEPSGDDEADVEPSSIDVGAGVKVKVLTFRDAGKLVDALKAHKSEDGPGAAYGEAWPRDNYVFLDPYDRASDLAAIQVTMRTTRGRVSGSATSASGPLPGTTMSARQFEALFKEVDSVVHVARNFRVERPEKDELDKLQFHAVVLDSRTARFESGGTRDRRQQRNADDPVRSPIDPPDRGFLATPTTRLHLNLMRLKKAWEQSPKLGHVCAVLDEPNVPAAGDRRGYWSAESFFDRWVRDLRFRRVGVALGGGGATGFAHVALMRALREEGIPIDLVSGTSFGALAGAYYCAQGLDGLDLLMEQALLYTGVASLTMLTSVFFEHLVNLSIDYRPMWELPIPFYAVATDIESGKAAVFPGPAAANPSVGFAVRASGSLPGFFAPAIAGDVRYLDGGAVSVVPIKALINAGADIVIGSNAFPFRKGSNSYAPTPLRGLLPAPFGRLAERLIAEFNPGNRMVDAARSMSLSLTDAMVKETQLASALYEHKRTDVKYWEFHRAALVFRAAMQDLPNSGALPAAVSAYRLINAPVT